MDKKNHVTNTFINMVNQHGVENVSKEKLCKRSKIPVGSFDYIMGCGFKVFKKKLTSNYDFKVTSDKQDLMLNVGICLALIEGYNNVTVADMATGCKVSRRSIYDYFGTVQNLRCKILLHAVKTHNVQIVIQGISNSDPITSEITPQLREKAAQYIRKGS